MNREEKEQKRLANREKNARRRDKKTTSTLYAREAREARRLNGGAFGQTDAATFNKLSEGTHAMRRSEIEEKRALEHHALTGE